MLRRVLPSLQSSISKSTMCPVRSLSTYEHINIEHPSKHVVHVQLNRPDKINAINDKMWSEIGEVFNDIGADEESRCVILSGNGRGFCSGIDLMGGLAEMAQMASDSSVDVSRRAWKLQKIIEDYQLSITAVEKCCKPVIALLHGVCFGGAIDLATACDIRYATEDIRFSIKEVDIGLAADVGTLQRLPKVVGNQSLVRELVYTAREFKAHEAQTMGLISRLFADKDVMLECAMRMAEDIASKSPVAVQGSKVNLNYSRDHSVDEGLQYMATWNSCHLMSEDVMKSAMASLSKAKEKPIFSKL